MHVLSPPSFKQIIDLVLLVSGRVCGSYWRNTDWEEMNFFWSGFLMTWGPWTWTGKNYIFFFFSLTCIWKIAFPSILSVGNKFLLYEQYLCLCHQQKLAIFISFYGCCNMLKYCLHISLPKKYEVIRPSLDLGI